MSHVIDNQPHLLQACRYAVYIEHSGDLTLVLMVDSLILAVFTALVSITITCLVLYYWRTNNAVANEPRPPHHNKFGKNFHHHPMIIYTCISNPINNNIPRRQ